MDTSSSYTRFFSLKEMVILTQTDTTVGFISQNEKKLQEIKQRESSKPFIKIYKDLKTLLEFKHRVPNKFKNRVRRSKKTSFIVKNKAFRVDNNTLDSKLLKDLSWHYSTSANERAKNFNREFCEKKTDIIIENKDGLRELSSSCVYKINNYKREKIR